jgi:hypothetical protein
MGGRRVYKNVHPSWRVPIDSRVLIAICVSPVRGLPCCVDLVPVQPEVPHLLPAELPQLPVDKSITPQPGQRVVNWVSRQTGQLSDIFPTLGRPWLEETTIWLQTIPFAETTNEVRQNKAINGVGSDLRDPPMDYGAKRVPGQQLGLEPLSCLLVEGGADGLTAILFTFVGIFAFKIPALLVAQDRFKLTVGYIAVFIIASWPSLFFTAVRIETGPNPVTDVKPIFVSFGTWAGLEWLYGTTADVAVGIMTR